MRDRRSTGFDDSSWSLRHKHSSTSRATLSSWRCGGHEESLTSVRPSPNWRSTRAWPTRKSGAAATTTISRPGSAIRWDVPSATSFAGCSSASRISFTNGHSVRLPDGSTLPAGSHRQSSGACRSSQASGRFRKGSTWCGRVWRPLSDSAPRPNYLTSQRSPPRADRNGRSQGVIAELRQRVLMSGLTVWLGSIRSRYHRSRSRGRAAVWVGPRRPSRGQVCAGHPIGLIG